MEALAQTKICFYIRKIKVLITVQCADPYYSRKPRSQRHENPPSGSPPTQVYFQRKETLVWINETVPSLRANMF